MLFAKCVETRRYGLWSGVVMQEVSEAEVWRGDSGTASCIANRRLANVPAELNEWGREGGRRWSVVYTTRDAAASRRRSIEEGPRSL